MLFLYRVLFTVFLFLFSFSLTANVGSVDNHFHQKQMACENSPESKEKTVGREVNHGRILANLLSEIEKPPTSSGSSADDEAIQ